VPNLGVVKVQKHRSFVIADIPGLIEGAADGAGLGIRFLKHLTRCRLLLHIVDMAPPDGSEPEDQVRTITKELESFSPTLAGRQRWLLLNKVDLLPEDEVNERCRALVEALDWQGPVFQISALQKTGTAPLCGQIMTELEQVWSEEAESEEARERENEFQAQMAAEVRERIETLRQQRRASRKEDDDDDDFDDDDYDVEVEYVR